MRKKFNKPDFEQLLELGCELEEVASFSERTKVPFLHGVNPFII